MMWSLPEFLLFEFGVIFLFYDWYSLIRESRNCISFSRLSVFFPSQFLITLSKYFFCLVTDERESNLCFERIYTSNLATKYWDQFHPFEKRTCLMYSDFTLFQLHLQKKK